MDMSVVSMTFGWFDGIYLLCLVVGFLYALFTGFVGGFFGVEHGHGDGDVGHMGDTGHGGLHFMPLSPMVIAMFITTFGATGLVCMKGFNVTQWYVHLPISMGSGLVVGFITSTLLLRIFRATQSSSEARLAELVGTEAEVTTTIPSDGCGEIAYIAGGVRYTAPARSIANAEIKQSSIVKIEKIVGGIFYVSDKGG